MTKQETYEYLTAHGVQYEITEHEAVYNMEELDAVDLPYPDAGCWWAPGTPKCTKGCSSGAFRVGDLFL